MERPLADLPEPIAPPGVELVPYLWDRDDEVRRAHNIAFVDHHGSSERDVASWEVMFTGRAAFRADLSTLVLEDGAVVAYALAYVFESDTRATGRRCVYFGQIGTLPAVRGRGLARAAVATSLRASAARDCHLAGLQVDSENGSGALALYERLGFGVIRRTTSWTRALPALGRR
jgi:ribosomal protein S18 acetylase RimI-like enzyme